MKQQNSTETVHVPGGPSIEVTGLSAFVCDSCHEQTLDLAVAAARRQKVLGALISHYEGQKIPGRVAHFMRLEMGVSAESLGDKLGKSHSALSRANLRDTELDGYASEQLLAIVTDFINGNSVATDRLKHARLFHELLSDRVTGNVRIISLSKVRQAEEKTEPSERRKAVTAIKRKRQPPTKHLKVGRF
jgi:YgiT-type zinc finger domain-containing protein